MIEWFIRLGVSGSFLSASADRFGLWPEKYSAWGNWQSFLDYTATLIPWAPPVAIPIFGAVATALEVLFGVALLVKFKTKITAIGSGSLLLLFAITMTLSLGIKAPLDYSVFSASAASFALLLFDSGKKNK